MYYGLIYIVLLFSNLYNAKCDNEFDYNVIADSLSNQSVIKDNFRNIQEGKFRFWQTTDCLDILYKSSPFSQYYGCYFQNPNEPYGLMLFPPHPDEEIDKYYGFPISDGNLTGTWKMNPGDVIVLLGRTPPECEYFSFSNYLYSRYIPPYWKPEYSKGIINLNCPSGDESDRCEYFASIDDSLNLDRGLNLNNESKFNTSFAIIFSQSFEGTNYALRGLIESGVPENLISNYSFPGKELFLGIGYENDTFINVMRTAYYKNNTEAENYFSEVPYRVLRMEYNGDTVKLYDRKSLKNRETKFNDASKSGESLKDMKKTIVEVSNNIIKNITNLDKNWYVQVSTTDSGAPDNGFECIDSGEVCLADCRDTLYPFSSRIYKEEEICKDFNIKCYGLMNGLLTLDNSDVLFVIGVNHALTNMSTYSSMSIYDANYLWGVNEISNHQMENTSWNYTYNMNLDEKQKKILPYIYVYEIRRNCMNISNCLEVPYSPTLDNKAVVPLSDPIVITERMYNNPITHVGPYLPDVILPTIIHLRRK